MRAEQVEDLPRLEARRRDQELCVGGLEQHVVEGAGADPLDEVDERRADDALEHRAHAHEVGDHDERGRRVPAGDRGAPAVERRSAAAGSAPSTRCAITPSMMKSARYGHRRGRADPQLHEHQRAGSASSAHRLEAAHAAPPHPQREREASRRPSRPARASSSASSRVAIGRVISSTGTLSMNRNGEYSRDRRAIAAGNSGERQEVAGQQREQAEVQVERAPSPGSRRTRARRSRTCRPNVIIHASASDGDEQRELRAARWSARCAPELTSRIDRDRQRDQRAERDRRDVARRVARRTDGSAGAGASTSMPMRISSLICQATQMLVRLRTISVREVVGDEVAARCSRGTAPRCATLVHSASMTSGMVVVSDPDQELGAVGDGLGDADAQQRRQRAQRPRHAHSAPRLRLAEHHRAGSSSSGGSSIARSATLSVPSRWPTTVAELALGDLQRDRAAPRARARVPSFGEVVVGDARSTSVNDTRLSGSIVLDQAAQVAVVDQRAAVDHDDPRAQRDDVVHVVRGQEHGRVVALVVAADEVADRDLHRDVEADRRLVEEQRGRAVEQGGRELALHALAERELARRLVERAAPRSSSCGQLVQRRVELACGTSNTARFIA